LEDSLSEAGFSCVSAASAEQAATLLEDGGAAIAALITDVNLKAGGLTGWDLATRARELNPDLPVIYVTALDEAEWAAHGVPKSILVSKPFVPAKVVTAVAQSMNAS
jgi:CheY-like chemotaxis protein